MTFELSDSNSCHFQKGDNIGWYHAGAGVIDYDTDDHATETAANVIWKNPTDPLKYGDSVSFTGDVLEDLGGEHPASNPRSEARTYSIGATGVYSEPSEPPVVDTHAPGTSICRYGETGAGCIPEPKIDRIGNMLADRRKSPDGASNMQFVDTSMVFARAGRVVEWDFFAGRAGSQWLQVWRPLGRDA